EPYGKEAGLPEGWAQIFALDGRINFNMDGQIFRFEESSHRFELDEQFVRDFPGITNIAGRPARDALGRVWMTANGSVHVLEGVRGHWRDLNEPMPPGFLPYAFTFETGGVVWMHSDRRMVRFDPAMPRAAVVPFRAIFSQLNFIASGRTIFPTTPTLPPLEANDSSFSARFLAPNSPFGSAVDFEVELEGVDSRWTSTGAGGSATFNHLKAGDYVLRVRPRAGGIVGGEAVLAFRVLPPWYLTGWAYLGYVLGAIGVAVLVARTVSILERREKVRLELLVEERTQELNAGSERRRRLEAQLLQAQKLESLGTLAGGIAHDFNNMLTSILGYCGLAVLSAGDNEALKADLNQIRAAGIRARDLVAQILTFSRQRKIILVALNLAEPVGDALKLVRASIPTTVEISSRLADGNVQADSTQIHQIVINLCQNAAHAMGARGGRVDVTLERTDVSAALSAEIPGLSPGPAMRLTISDNGCGIPPATLERIFDPFFTTKSPGEGTGLGLSIVQGIVHSHLGAVRVRSQLGIGTTFDLFFPRTSEPVAPVPKSNEVPRGNAEKILVVDDEPSVATYLAKQLEHLGYLPTVFTDPREALAEVTARPQRFRAIVTDLTMPHLTGVELVQGCRAAGAELPALIITGYGT
ncbi:MAG: ATP-binding protein, partial [Lacunisphaera sp.]